MKFLVVCFVIWQRFRRINGVLDGYGDKENYDDVTKEVDAIKLSCKLHAKLSAVVKSFNKLYNVPILMFCLTAFANGVLEMFSFFQKTCYQHKVDLKNLVFVGNNLLVTMLPAILVSISSYCIKIEASKTAGKLHKVRNKDDERIRNMIQIGSLQLFHENVVLTAGGLFELGPTFLHAVLAASVSYFVITIQLDPSWQD
ncbi:putative gustatory receptor 28b [Ctenocephalides felis]|uniref:putative gustatory receptor 28b n=1 Tax=Ctenocephalides felis TaxID=7515 RepID=UPI000E6E3FFB|nr:putative gustatory receptor 28b [Ctenocephalides felis]